MITPDVRNIRGAKNSCRAASNHCLSVSLTRHHGLPRPLNAMPLPAISSQFRSVKRNGWFCPALAIVAVHPIPVLSYEV